MAIRSRLFDRLIWVLAWSFLPGMLLMIVRSFEFG